MKKIIVFILLYFFAVSAYAGDSILGKWKDKTYPFSYQFEFKENNDFIYTHNEKTSKGETDTYVYKGVWELGTWTITTGKNIEGLCTLTIYVGTRKCCFEYKFIGNNLILRNKYESGSYPSSICNSRVLIKVK